ncbi:MAG TPA: Holliday junction resolvase RuvX [Opitutaceae bacterium]
MKGSSPRFLGIDFGTKRIGLAYGDEIGVATPMPALVENDAGRRWSRLLEVIGERRITEIVLGLPLNMDGTSGPKADEARAMAERLIRETGLPVHLADESLTSYDAESTIPPSRRRDIRKSGTIDSRAAALILQDYLEQRLGGRGT